MLLRTNTFLNSFGASLVVVITRIYFRNKLSHITSVHCGKRNIYAFIFSEK